MSFSINVLKGSCPEHMHDCYEIVVYTVGRGVFRTADDEFHVSPGKIIIIPPGIAHSSDATEPEFERIFISGEFSQLFHLTVPTVVSDNSEDEGLMLAKMIYQNSYSEGDYMTALVNAFTHFLLQGIKMGNEVFSAVNSIVEKITCDFHNPSLNLAELLRSSGYAEDYIRAQFKAIMGKTPTEFLTEIRINHACYLIDTYKNSFSLADVALMCGYADYVYFSRRFKHITGISPRKYAEKTKLILHYEL